MAQEPQFQSAQTLLRQGSQSFEVRLPDDAVDDYDIAASTPIKWTPQLDGSTLGVTLQIGNVDESLATVTRVRQSGETTTWYGKVPKPMAVALGMGPLCEMGAQAIIERVDDSTLKLRTAPAMTPWTGHNSEPSMAVQNLDVVEKPLYAIRTPDNRSHPMQFRFDFGKEYRDAYELERGQDVGLRYGAVDGQLALMIDFDPESDAGYRRKLQRYEAGVEGHEVDVIAVYPHKAHVQSLGLGTDPLVEDETPEIRVLTIPGSNEVALLPADTDADQEVPDEMKQESSSTAEA